MVKLCRSLLIVGIFMLIVLGLNVSNQGINSLIAQNRQPVLALQVRSPEVTFITLGESHSIDARSTRPYLNLLGQNWDKGRHLVKENFKTGNENAHQMWLDLKRQMRELSSSP